MEKRRLAVVTGASTGIGYELARVAALDGMDLIICADEPEIEAAAEALRGLGAAVEAVRADLGLPEGVAQLVAAVGARPVDVLIANAGRGLAGAFLDQDLAEAMDVLLVNVAGALMLVHAIGRSMRSRGQGRILITGSIAGYIPGSHHAMYNASKAFLDNFSYALRDELKGSGVTVTCLMPGATETAFFGRAGLDDTGLGAAEKADPADVARQGYDAMMNGDAAVVPGFMNRVQTMFAGIIPPGVLAAMHRRMAQHDVPRGDAES